MSPQHDPTEFPEPTYKEAVEGWQHCQTVNTQLLEALEELIPFCCWCGGKGSVPNEIAGIDEDEWCRYCGPARAAIKAAKGD